MCIIFSFAGFVGFFSIWISAILPIYSILSVIYIFVSWENYGWTQNFSTNHPRKGETIHFDIRFSNDAFFPLLGGTCTFAMPDSEKQFPLPVGFFPSSPYIQNYSVDISCPYRGTYIAGIKSIHLSTPLGIIQTELDSPPQTFYVYPELCPLPHFSESLTITSGTTISGTSSGQEDVAVFESVAPLLPQQSGRIAWKKWAATGVPSLIVSGYSRSQAVTVVLDLYESQNVTKNERLASEDIVISATFSLLQHLVYKKIPVTFICGSSANPILIDNEDSFKDLYERSVNIFFNDSSFPQVAFNETSAVFLFTSRPLIDLYSDYEKNLQTGTEPHLFLCPPEPLYKEEKDRANVVNEQRQTTSSRSLFYVANVKNGSKEISDAFKS